MTNLDTVFHISDNDYWSKVLANIKNYLKDIGDNMAKVEVVANSNAVKAYENQDLVSEMKTLYYKGVTFIACRNALEANSIEKSDLPNFVKIVPGAIHYLVIKQAEGYAYIKP